MSRRLINYDIEIAKAVTNFINEYSNKIEDPNYLWINTDGEQKLFISLMDGRFKCIDITIEEDIFVLIHKYNLSKLKD